ncbi:MAG: AAA family ATPase [Acidimicrobiaceae bacterium]|nr:AAA family ATPase [Acidimicrobiaceae bacterium]
MYERIHIDNYKCLVNFDLHLSETSLLVGSNGSGKTAVLDVVFGLRRLLAGEAKVNDRIAFHPSTLTRWQPGREQLFEMDVSAYGEKYRYRLKVEHTLDERQSRVVEESLVSHGDTLFRCDLGEVRLYRDDGSEGPAYRADWSESALARVAPQPANTRLTTFMELVQSTVVCSIRPALLGAESEREAKYLGRHAENFVDWYRHAVQENPGSVRSHVEALRPVVEGFDNVHLQQAGLDKRALMLDFRAKGAAPDGSARRFKLRFDELSDGQRALVVLYALLHLRDEERGAVLFLDEPDNFVALAELQPWLLALVELCEETSSQAVLCSHHPELIDYLGPDSGLLLHRETSAVTVAPLRSPDLPDCGLKLSELMARGWER